MIRGQYVFVLGKVQPIPNTISHWSPYHDVLPLLLAMQQTYPSQLNCINFSHPISTDQEKMHNPSTRNLETQLSYQLVLVLYIYSLNQDYYEVGEKTGLLTMEHAAQHSKLFVFVTPTFEY